MIANYLLDVLVHDAFRVEDKNLYEVQVGIDSDEPEQEIVGTHEQLKKIKFRQYPVPISLPYYEEAKFMLYV